MIHFRCSVPLILVIGFCAALPWSTSALAENWSTWQHDNRRSGFSAETIDAQRLQPDWEWDAPAIPQRAWHGPAKWDAYARIRDLPSMRSYDLAYHVAATEDGVYFGSSSDDSVRCLDPEDGEEKWVFVTDGPVRIAPTVRDGRVWFGSDDGHAYCLEAKTGKLVWKFRPVEPGPLILNNGRFIPFYPCRTGVTVDGPIARFACGMLPWKDSYLCAIDAKTGKVEGTGSYVKKLSGKTLEGAPAMSSKLVLFPQGRVAPQVFRRTDGKDLGALKKSGGGSLVVVTLDSKLIHGPATDSRKGGIASSDPKTLEMVAGFGRGNALVVNERTSFMLTGDELIASDLATKEVKFRVPCDLPYSLIGAGNVLFAGGDEEVAAFSVEDGRRLWAQPVDGRAYGLAVAWGRLYVSTEWGTIHAFREGDSSVLASNPIEKDPQESTRALPPKLIVDERLLGRWVLQRGQIDGNQVRNLAGGRSGVLETRGRISQAGPLQALEFDGQKQSLKIAPSHRQAKVPRRTISVEVWVRPDTPQTWGGIVGAVQDNGDFERGWLLGLRESKFSFALAGAEGNGRLTYLTAADDFTAEHWYHVAATYDGRTMALFVNGEKVATSTAQQGDIRYPPQAFYEIGAYHDKDEHFRFNGALHEVRVYDDVLTDDEIAGHYREKVAHFPKPVTHHQLALGPWFQFTEPGEAVVRWRTTEPSPSIIEVRRSDKQKSQVFRDNKLKTEHERSISGLNINRLYLCRIHAVKDGKQVATDEIECDTFFDYTNPQAGGSAPFPAPGIDKNIRASRTLRDIVRKEFPQEYGIAVVLGLRDGILAHELVELSRLRVICFDDNKERIDDARQSWLGQTYGARITAHYVPDLNKLPTVGHFANLVVSERPLAGETVSSPQEVMRILRPDGGVAVFAETNWGNKATLAQPLRQWLEKSKIKATVRDEEDGVWVALKRGPLDGAGDWTHLYGRADNSAFAGETLAGVRSTSDLDIQWLGRPGPRYQADRSGRKPSPLAAGGRLFLQGLDRIIALDSYNGTVLWSLEVPGFRRFNVARDSSNWCADRNFVYAVVKNRVWQIDAETGEVKQFLDVLPAANREWKSDWGFVARAGNHVIGTAVKAESSWTDFSGTEGWYDARSGPETHQVCSDRVFALSTEDGSESWSRQAKGVVLNASITIAEGKVFFVECRHPDVLKSPDRRVGGPKLWQQQYLVAVDANTGSPLWEKPLDTADGTAVFYLAQAKNKLIAVSSTDKKYHVYAYSDDGGRELWHQSFGWIEGKGDHGKAMSRPAIVGDRIFVRPRVLSLTDGKLLPQTMPGGGCGTYACTSNALFFRSGEVTIWDSEKGRTTKFTRLRPDCWLSTIPAGGMLLSPEGGGGCSCGNWMETSIGFMPVSRRR